MDVASKNWSKEKSYAGCKKIGGGRSFVWFLAILPQKWCGGGEGRVDEGLPSFPLMVQRLSSLVWGRFLFNGRGKEELEQRVSYAGGKKKMEVEDLLFVHLLRRPFSRSFSFALTIIYLSIPEPLSSRHEEEKKKEEAFEILLHNSHRNNFTVILPSEKARFLTFLGLPVELSTHKHFLSVIKNTSGD
ncbi:hypothetical protein CEXT_158321 [Caerostris extrusa]|uniref:Uncharacterized protein n=1 Tax=Caerostris extrusa TaxID=172846 RepID=A0AAV4PM25_CAEEX|nr:hypothetical protein CEXT_158321 [Caerostris extrusa]